MQAFHAWQSPLSASLKHIGQAKREQITGGQEHHEKKKITASIDFSTTIPTMTMLLHIVPTINSTN
jgi:hypothetical protein